MLYKRLYGGIVEKSIEFFQKVYRVSPKSLLSIFRKSIDFSPTAPYKHSVPSHLPPQHHPPPLRKLSSLSPNFPSSIFFANIAPQAPAPRFFVSNSLLYLFRSMVRFVARGRRVCSDIALFHPISSCDTFRAVGGTFLCLEMVLYRI